MTSSGDWRRDATTEQMTALTRAIDPTVAHIARIQDYWLGEPGVIRCPEWRPDRPEDAAGKSAMWGGVARKPDHPGS